jgi:putative ABC transport system permease protein
MSLSSGTDALDQEMTEQRNWDVEVQLSNNAPVDEVSAVVAQVPGVARVEVWSRTPTGVAGPGEIPMTRTYPDQGHGGVSVTAVPDDTVMLPPPNILDGRWLRPGETGGVVVNQIARNNTVPDVAVGDTVQLLIARKPTSWIVVGLVEERGGQGGVYVTAEGLAEATGRPRLGNQLRIVTDDHDERSRAAIADIVKGALNGAGFEVGSAVSVSRSEAISAGHLGPVIVILLGIALPLGVVGGIGLATTMSTNVLDRTREFGVMHAIGARPKAVRRIVVAEGVFLALTSVVVAVLPTLILIAVLGAGLGNLFMDVPLPYRVSALAVGIWLVLVVLGAILATDAAATRASRLTVREALAYL